MSALEQSITLEDVFSVVEAKRVPLAPELAGYLALEIADGSDAGGGDVDPKTVFISEEGTVALVRPRSRGDLGTGDAEASIRRLLVKLLDASGSGTPALSTAARRKPGNGLPALVEELEAALIPVNRAAGRRAMARLAREVKRVLLGVGRNASVAAPPRTEAKPATKPIGSAAPHARPLVRKRSLEVPASERGAAPTSDRAVLPDVPARESVDPVTAALESIQGEAAALFARAVAPAAAEPRPAIHDALTVDPGAVAPAPAVASLPAPPERAPLLPPSERSGLRPPAARRVPAPAPVPGLPPPAAPARGVDPVLFGGDEVDNLLETFGVSNLVEDNKQVSRDLKAMAGLEPTPPPPDAKTLAELTKDVGNPAVPLRLDAQEPGENASWTPPPPLDGDSVEALLALADASAPPPALARHAPPDPSPEESRKVPPPLSDSQLGRKVPAPPPLSDSQLGRKVPPPLSDAQLGRKDQNLPPSPLFGGGSGAAPGLAAGAPAALRHSAAELPDTPDSTRDAAPSSRADAPKTGRSRGEPRPPTTARGRVKTGSGGKRAPKTGLALLLVTLVVLGGASVAIWKFAPQVFTGRRPIATAPPASSTVATPPVCKVALVLTDVPANAEILLRMGQAPVDVERMPVGTRLEFVGTAEGQVPKRTVIKADTSWDKGADGKPRVEVPIQLDASKAKPGAVDPWPPAEPGSQVGGSGAPGTVHVVSNVRGAEVWLLAGLGPEARIDQLRCDSDIDVLLAGGPVGETKTPLRKRLHVSEKDIAAANVDPKGNKVVTVDAKDH